MKVYSIFILLITAILFSQDPIFETSFETDPFTEGWTLQTTGAGWLHQESDVLYQANTGDYLFCHLDDQGVQNDWLISPVISLPVDGNPYLTFYEKSRYVDYIGFHEVCVTNDSGSTWQQISATIPDEDDYDKILCTLQGFSGQNIQIGWHYTGNYSDQWLIDDVMIGNDIDAPVVKKLYSERMILPIIGEVINKDMIIRLFTYDVTSVDSVKAFYSFDGGSTFNEVEMIKQVENYWYYVIPARSSAVQGTIRFEISDIFSNTLSTENYPIEFVDDIWVPIIQDMLGNVVQVNDDANLSLLLADLTNIAFCTGYYSKDDFATQYEFELNPSKDTFYYYGTIPAENELIKGEVRFVIDDTEGNTLVSRKYEIEWINSLPENFDLRTSLDENYVTSVKVQRAGTCWMFATAASMESNLLMNGNWELQGEAGEPDLSEYHIDWWSGFNDFFNADIDPPTGDGVPIHVQSTYYITASYLMRGEGAVRDIDAPEIYVQPERFSDDYHYYYARDIEWYKMDSELNGINLIKEKIIENGTVGIGLVHSFLDQNTYIHYQPPADELYMTHGVAIIGWDDTIVTPAPEGPGAWFVKNAWGPDQLIDGYYWVSYYDKYSGKGDGCAVSFKNVERMKYDDVYYHDYHGFSDVLTEADEAFNAFAATKDSWLSAVSFFCPGNNIDFTVKIFKDFTDNQLSNMVSEVSGHIEYTGYHTIDLLNSVFLESGEDFYIYLYLSDGGQPYDQSSYVTTAFVTYESSASPGESYYKQNDQWVDLYENISIENPQTANFCIKGLCNDDSSIDQGSNSIKGYELEQNYPNPFNPNTTINFSVPQDNSKIKLLVYNVNGQIVNTLFDGVKNIGRHKATFDASSLNSGVYYYTLEVNGVKKVTKKMVMIK